MTVLLAHAGATCFLAGLSWVVLLVVYPSFRVVGPTAAWPAFHAAHSRRTAAVVTLPWVVQGASVAVLLLRDPGSPLVLVTAALALATVVLTVAGAVPVHERLSAYDAGLVDALLRAHRWRTAAWTLGAAASLLLVSRG